MKKLFYSEKSFSQEMVEQMKNSGMYNLPNNCVLHYYQLEVEDEEVEMIKDVIRENCPEVRFYSTYPLMTSAIENDKFVAENVAINANNAKQWVDFTLEVVRTTGAEIKPTHSLKGKMMSSCCLENFETITYYNRVS